jgi:hypothetical protein
MPRRPMTERDWMDLAARYDAGETYEQIALDLGMSSTWVSEGLRGRVRSRPAGQREGTHPLNRANANAKSTISLDPAARVVRPSMVRWLR